MGLADLPTLNGQPARACPKPEKRSRTKGRKDRAEAKVKKAVRALCVLRDGRCRADYRAHRAANDFFDALSGGWPTSCDGPAEWAHMHAKRRSQTRGQAPEKRHDTAHSLMLCKFHHDCYDGRQRPRLLITALTRKGADGPLKFRRDAK